MFDFNLFIVLVAFAGNVLLGLFTFLKNPKSATSWLFFLFAAVLDVYIIFNYIATIAVTDANAYFWVKNVMAVALLINLVFFLLADCFPNTNWLVSPKLFWFSLIPTLILLPITQTNLVFVSAKAYGLSAQPGIAMPLFLIHTILLLGGGMYILIRKFFKFKGRERIQVKLFLLGAVIMFLSIIITNLLFVIILDTGKYVSLLPVYTLIFVGFISYAIIKHQFLDIPLLIARAVSYALLAALFGVLYSLLFSVIALVISGTSSPVDLTVSTLLAVIMAFSFQPVRRFLEKITDKIFYKDRYDASKLLYEMSVIMASTLHLEELTHQLLKKLITQMRIIKGSFILLEKGKIYFVAHEGYKNAPEFDESDMVKLLQLNQTLIFEELPENQEKGILRKLLLTISIKLHVEGEDLGLLVLGGKLSGDIYNKEDIKVIEIFAPEVALAIQNAKAYEEISRFNITLQDRITQATQDLRIVNTKLQQLDRLKDDFVSIASHELRTPMTVIRSYAWMALNRSDMPLSDKLKRYLEKMFLSTERLINLVNDMLNISRIESGKIEVVPQVFDISVLSSDVFLEVGPKAKEKKLSLKVEYAKIPKVFADSDKVHQVLLNLIGNAIKFTPEGGMVTVSFFSDGNTVETSISDNGVGIAAEDLQALFKKFGRLDNSYTAAAASGGTGLGLYICKSLVELMGGRIWAKSGGIGKGATFTFFLPAATNKTLAHPEVYTRQVNGEVKLLEPVMF